jgi:hypothetical protein
LDRKNASQAEAWTTVVLFGLTLTLVFGSAYLCINDSLFRVMIALAQQSELLASRYFGEVSPEQIFTDAWHGMQGAIPFRVELSDASGPSELREQRHDWGLTLAPADSSVTVVNIAASSPFHGFLLPEDRITGIDSLHEDIFANFVEYLNRHQDGATRIFFERDGRADSVTVKISSEKPSDNLSVEFLDSIAYFHLALPAPDGYTSQLAKLSSSGALAFIIDLRNSRGDDHDQAIQLSEQLRSIIAARPTAVLLDGSTKGVSEDIARQLMQSDNATSIGTTTAGMPSIVEEVQLRTGRRLYVSLNETLTQPADEADDSSAVPTASAETSTAVIPELRCTGRQLTPLLFELVHGGYLLDFVTSHDYEALPGVADEDSLFSQFERFLEQRRFRFDPLGRALSDMSINEMGSDMTPIYRHMQKLHHEIVNPGLLEYRDEILRSLLKAIFEVKIGGEPSLSTRARTDDPCLAEALSHLQDQIRK